MAGKLQVDFFLMNSLLLWPFGLKDTESPEGLENTAFKGHKNTSGIA
ncbi:hypothetical protein GP5015_1301 [gamma proteobacterium HTCC5015]|nr:hypothetical protein GP5015_1301 [gamma proteobacterium HTCC5015]